MHIVLFLQGLLLIETKNWTCFLSSEFQTHHNHTNHNFNKYGISSLEASLEFISNIRNLVVIVFVIYKLKDLNEILSIWKTLKNTNTRTLESNSDFF